MLQLVSIKGGKIQPWLNNVVEFFMFSEFMAVAVVSIHNIWYNIKETNFGLSVRYYDNKIQSIIDFFTSFFLGIK